MSTKVHLYSKLRSYADDKGTVDVNGTTVGECLMDLIRQFPKLRNKLFDASGKLFPQVFVSINMNSTNPEKTDSPISEGDELYIVFIVAGG